MTQCRLSGAGFSSPDRTFLATGACDRGRVKTRLQIAYAGRYILSVAAMRPLQAGRDQAAIAVISGLTPKMLIMRFML